MKWLIVYQAMPHIKLPSTVADIIAGLDIGKSIVEFFNVIYDHEQRLEV